MHCNNEYSWASWIKTSAHYLKLSDLISETCAEKQITS